mgnify:FL=1
MFIKSFYDTSLGLKQLIAYELYVTHGLYQKDIADYLGCSNNTVANNVKKNSNYKHLRDFNLVIKAKNNYIQDAINAINAKKESDL